MARKTSAEWTVLVARWKRSGLSAREFGAKARVNPRSLHWWSWALAKRVFSKNPAPTSIEEAPAFLPIRVVQHDAPSERSSALAGNPIEIVVDEHLALRVGAGFDEDTLMRVLGLVRRTGGN